MSKTLYDRATHRDGALLWSGGEAVANPSEIDSLRNDMTLELAKALTYRSCVFEPAKIGMYSTVELGGVFGDGWKVGSAPGAAWYDLITSGHTKAGLYQLDTRSGAPNAQVSVISPNAFEVHATKDVKFYFRGSINSVADTMFFTGLSRDQIQSSSGWPGVISDVTPGPTATDSIGFFRVNAAASTTMIFAVYDGSVSTNSSQTVTFPGTINDDVEFECGFHVSGADTITVYMKVGLAETVQRIERVAGTTLDLLTTSIGPLSAVVGAANNDDASTGGRGVAVRVVAATQPL